MTVDFVDGALRFPVAMPAMGYATYLVVKATEAVPESKAEAGPRAGPVVIENGLYRLEFDGASGLLAAISNKASGVTTKVLMVPTSTLPLITSSLAMLPPWIAHGQATQYWAWYNSSNGYDWEHHGQVASHLIFSPISLSLFFCLFTILFYGLTSWHPGHTSFGPTASRRTLQPRVSRTTSPRDQLP